MYRRIQLLAISICLLLLNNAQVRAQFAQRSSISGFVTDSSKAPIAGAVVTLKDLDRNREKSNATDGSGHYVFSDLTIGHYQVNAEYTGFKHVTSPPIDLTTQEGNRLDLTLTPAGSVETVTVTASPKTTSIPAQTTRPARTMFQEE